MNVKSDDSNGRVEPALGVEATLDWRTQRSCSIWISGYKTVPMSIAELWQVSLSRVVILLSFSIGAAAGVAGAVAMANLGYRNYGFFLLFSFVPLFVNTGSSALVTLLVYLRHKMAPDAPGCTIPSALCVFVASAPLIATFILLLEHLVGRDWGLITSSLLLLPLVYVAISEPFHFIVFHYVAPRFWELAPERALEPRARYEGPASREITLGKVTVDEAELLYLEAQDNYVRIVTQHSEHLQRFRISAAADLISPGLGVFLHRSRWVALHAVSRLERNKGTYHVVLENGDRLTLASTREQQVVGAMKDYGIEVRRKGGQKRMANGRA